MHLCSVYQIKYSHVAEHFHSGSKDPFIYLPQQKLTSLLLFTSHSLYLPSTPIPPPEHLCKPPIFINPFTDQICTVNHLLLNRCPTLEGL